MRSSWLLLVLPLVLAAPTPAIENYSISTILASLCQITILQKFFPVKELCKRSVPPLRITVTNPVGLNTTAGVVRYSVKYATAGRWQSPVISTVWTPAVASNPTALPMACPQSIVDPSKYSEDCLDLVLYVPPAAKTTSGGVPTIVWIHGGSFRFGSASDPALDGSKLAVATGSIVAVIQYRLGALGLIPPAASATNGNLALQDVITALTFLHGVLPTFGGQPGTPYLTLAGQSSGASLIRALLGTPAALPLFTNAWLHSDPVNYGFLTPGGLEILRQSWNEELGCTDNCGQTMDLPTLLDHADTLFSDASGIDPEFYFAEPFRPSPDNVFMTSRFTSSSSFAPSGSLKPIVVTTVKDEAVPSIYGFFPALPDPGFLVPFLNGNIGPDRTSQVLNSSFYQPINDDIRISLSTMGTDSAWRCASYKLVRDWAAHGSSKQYSGVITKGITYPDNSSVYRCLDPGVVCHQDDIQVLFGTGPITSPLTAELQARYKAFVRTSNPNSGNYKSWSPATASDTKTINLGGSSAITLDACVPTFWGSQVQFDYQVNNE